jgi:CheY-like chemotaxis protein
MTIDHASAGDLLPSDRGVASLCRLRILVVEDHQHTAATLAELLRLYGHEVLVASAGVEALHQAKLSPPDVVLLDIGLPGMDGWELTQRIQELPGCDRLLLVALTGYGQEADRERSRQAGIHLHLLKPVEPAALEQLLERFQTILFG